MPQLNTIQYLKNHEINKSSWDDCINNSSNGLIYAYSSYLDHMAENWDALVLNNYEMVMPLPFRKKYGIHYLYQPFLTAQLGLFGNEIKKEMLNAFLSSIPNKFRLWEFSLNHGNHFSIEGFDLYERKNFVLGLCQSFESIYKQYRENVRRNIKRSLHYGCHQGSDPSIQEVIALLKINNATIRENDYNNFIQLFRQLHSSGQAKTYGVYSNTNQLLASAVFLFSNNRAYYILVGNHPNGKTLGASHALINNFIKDHAGQNMTLDFEGSDISSLAFFYSSFGAREEIYTAIRMNRLPWYARLFKK